MIPDTNLRIVKSDGVQNRGTFGISSDAVDQAFIMKTLSDTLYSDKVKAVMREYGSNAWDAHRQAGLDNLPIKVVLPTDTEPTLIIRDFGPGLSSEDVFGVYTQFGASTKRNSNRVVGTLGIGSKSGFAYSDNFTVTSWHDGKKAIYTAYLNAQDFGEITQIHEEDCGDETGIEIRIPIQPKDVHTFRNKAIGLYRYFEPQPDINIDLPQDERTVTEHGFISNDPDYSDRHWIARMGCVPYRIDLVQVEDLLTERGLQNTLGKVYGGIYFDIGDVQISASREELKYSDKTKIAIANKLQALFEAYVEDCLETLRKNSVSFWEKRIKVRRLADGLNLPIPKAYKKYTQSSVVIYDDKKPATFTLASSTGESPGKISVDEHAKAYYRDDRRALKGFSLGSRSVVITPVDGTTRDAVIAEFETLCKKAEVEGITVEDLSTHSWYNPNPTKAKKTPNKKHRVRTFKLKTDGCYYTNPWSKTWEIETREPTDDDVFVIISGFRCVGWDDFHNQYRRDEALAKDLGTTMPPVYGYKTTGKKLVQKKDCKGTYYREWRVEFFKKLVTPKHLETIKTQEWAEAIYTPHYSRSKEVKYLQGGVDLLTGKLGATHPVTAIFQKCKDAKEALGKIGTKQQKLAEKVTEAARMTLNDHEVTKKALFKAYPLLSEMVDNDGFRSLLDKDSGPLWTNYIKMVDDAAALEETLHEAAERTAEAIRAQAEAEKTLQEAEKAGKAEESALWAEYVGMTENGVSGEEPEELVKKAV
jgi:hypothetical protein